MTPAADVAGWCFEAPGISVRSEPPGDFATQSKQMASSIEFDVAFVEDLQCAFDARVHVGAARFRHRLKCQMSLRTPIICDGELRGGDPSHWTTDNFAM